MHVAARIALATIAALTIAVLATYAGSKVKNPAIIACADSSCKAVRTEYHSYGWPVPWKIDAPTAVLEQHLRAGAYGSSFGVRMTPSGVSPLAFLASTLIWFWTTLAFLVVGYVLMSHSWRGWPNRLRLPALCVLALGLASVATILGALATSPGVFNNQVPYESAGFPIEWKTSPWLMSEAEGPNEVERYHDLVRPFNMLGFSPLYLTVTFLLWLIPTVFVGIVVPWWRTPARSHGVIQASTGHA
jgi:hypothetical protein